MHDIGLTTQHYAYVVSAFQAAYAVAQPFAGYVLDLIGLRIGFALFAAAWSAANISVALAGGWTGLATARALLGLAESAGIPAAMKTVKEWFPAQERSIATGWFNAGASIGSMLAPPLVVFCIIRAGWQSAFVATGLIGFLWALLWAVYFRKPADHRRLSATERVHILSKGSPATTSATLRPSWSHILRSRNFAGLAAARFLSEPAWQTFNYWIPVYLVTVRHMNLTAVAAIAWIPFLAADLGSVAGGYLAPLYQQWLGLRVTAALKLVVFTGSLLMAGPALIGSVVSPYSAIALFCLGALAHQVLSCALYTLTSNVFEEHELATTVGLTGSCGYIGGMLFSLFIGGLSARTGFGPIFVSLSILDVAAAVIVASVVRYGGDARSAAPSA